MFLVKNFVITNMDTLVKHSSLWYWYVGQRVDIHILCVNFQTGVYKVKTSSSLGKLLLVKVEKDPYLFLPEDEWYCSKIEVTTPENEEIVFPCYRWLSRGEVAELRGGKGLLFKVHCYCSWHPASFTRLIINLHYGMYFFCVSKE